MTTETAPRTAWCWWCRQAVRHDATDARRVDVYTVEGDPVTGTTVKREEVVCGSCWNATSPTVPLDMTEGENHGD